MEQIFNQKSRSIDFLHAIPSECVSTASRFLRVQTDLTGRLPILVFDRPKSSFGKLIRLDLNSKLTSLPRLQQRTQCRITLLSIRTLT